MFPQIFGKYVLEREIAAGGMARVYLGTLRGAVGFEKRLVVKQIRPELASDDAFVRRFVDEAKTAVELSHPNIVPVYELGVEQGIYYIAMELCEGMTLAEILHETGSLSPEEGAYVGVEICRALDYAHRRANIVHRDITPRNVMIDDEGAIRIIDFGIAAPVTLPDQEGSGNVELFGSPGHMPPEQLAGMALTPATDVFAVAALLAEAWTGRAPFRRKTPADCVEALRTPPPRIDAERAELAPVAELVAGAMALAPEARPPTAEAFSRPLREFLKSADSGDVARRLAERVRRTRRKLMASSPALVPEPAAEPDLTAPIREPRPRAPSIGDTQTFAVRNDLVEWTRKLPSAPPPPPDVVVEPVPASEVLSTRPLVKAEAPAESRDEPAPATSNGERASQVSRPSRGTIGVAIAVVAVVAIWGSSRLVSSPPSDATRPALSASMTPSATPEGSTPLVEPPGSARETKPLPPESALPRATSAPSRTLPPPSGEPSAVSPERSGKATLNLTSTPPSQVSVSGRSYGSTPVMGLQLPAGSYSVIFDSAALGLRTGTSLKLTPGSSKSVHADFGTGEGRVFVH